MVPRAVDEFVDSGPGVGEGCNRTRYLTCYLLVDVVSRCTPVSEQTWSQLPRLLARIRRRPHLLHPIEGFSMLRCVLVVPAPNNVLRLIQQCVHCRELDDLFEEKARLPSLLREVSLQCFTQLAARVVVRCFLA